MKERPIIMQAESVRAILDGRKTQTRRVVSEKLLEKYAAYDEWCNEVSNSSIAPSRDYEQGFFKNKCPHGQPGDRLWVREKIELSLLIGEWASSCYSADGQPTVADAWPWDTNHLSPLFMPRGLSRITLELVNVRVERVQDISRQDAKAEGFWPSPHNGLESFNGQPYGNAQLAYRACWQSINGKNQARCWDANPWVWVLEFKRVAP